VSGLDVAIGDDLESLTAAVSIYKARLYDKEMWFMDTPGFNDTNDVDRSDTVVLSSVSAELLKQHQQGLRINGVIYLHKITDDKMYGTNIRNLRMFQQLVGEHSLRNVTLVTTKWDTVTPEDGEKREKQLKEKYWAGLTAYGAKVTRVRKDDHGSYVAIVRDLMQNMGVTLQIQEELGRGIPLEQSGAGKVQLEAVNKATESLKGEMKELTDEFKRTKERGQEDMKHLEQVLSLQKGQLETQLQQAQRDRELLRQSIQDLRAGLDSRPPPPPPQATPFQNLNVLDARGGFPLYWAACDGRYDDVKRMLEAGANASMRTLFLWTPLHWAVSNGHWNVAQLLLAYNADVHAVSDTGKTPLSLARTEDMRQLLRQHGARY
jgi:hypothetical protein